MNTSNITFILKINYVQVCVWVRAGAPRWLCFPHHHQILDSLLPPPRLSLPFLYGSYVRKLIAIHLISLLL